MPFVLLLLLTLSLFAFLFSGTDGLLLPDCSTCILSITCRNFQPCVYGFCNNFQNRCFSPAPPTLPPPRLLRGECALCSNDDQCRTNLCIRGRCIYRTRSSRQRCFRKFVPATLSPSPPRAIRKALCKPCARGRECAVARCLQLRCARSRIERSRCEQRGGRDSGRRNESGQQGESGKPGQAGQLRHMRLKREECEPCARGRQCQSGFCFQEICVLDRNPESVVRCRQISGMSLVG